MVNISSSNHLSKMFNKAYTSFFILQIIFFLGINSAIGQTPRWEDFTNYSIGLNSNKVDDIVINSQGDIWLMSVNQFIYLAPNHDRFSRVDPNRSIKYLEIDQHDSIWLVNSGETQISTPNGIDYLIMTGYFNDTFTEFYKSDYPDFPHNTSSIADRITAFYIDTNGNKWFGFANGDVGMFNIQNTYTHYPNTFVSNENVIDISVDATSGKLFAAIGRNLFSMASGVWTLETDGWANTTYLKTVGLGNDGTVYFAGYQGLHTMKNGVITTQNTSNSSIPANDISDILVSGNKIYLSGKGNDNYQYLFDTDFSIYHKTLYSFNETNSAPIFLETSSPLSLWFGTVKEGLVHINNTSKNYFNNQTISLPSVYNAFVNRTVFVGNDAYVATKDGLTIKRGSLFEGLHPYYSTPEVLYPGGGKVNDIAYDSLEYLYIATDSGVAQLQVSNQTISKIISTPTSQKFFKVFPLIKGKVMAVATDQFMVLNADGTYDVYDIPVDLPRGNGWKALVPEINIDLLSGFWTASAYGLHFYDWNTVTDFNTYLYDNRVTALTEGPNGNLWLGFGTYGDAIQRFDKGNTWNTYNLPAISPNWLTSQDIVDLEFDAANTLWVLAQGAANSNRFSKLLEYKNNTFTVLNRELQDWSADLAISPTGEKWLANRRGLFIYVDDTYSNLDPCLTVICPPGLECVNGTCQPPPGPCDNITCPIGQLCYEGGCFDQCVDNGGNTSCTDLGPNIIVDAGSGIILDAGPGYQVYQWSTGDTTQTILADASGRYWVIAYDTLNNTYSSDTVDILIKANALGECPIGLVNKDGYCFGPTSACDGITCPAGQVCYEGTCYDPCANNCEVGNTCYAGNCFVDESDACATVSCPADQVCYGGTCFAPCANDGNSSCPDLGNNLVGDAGSEILLDAGPDYQIYQWSTGETTQSIVVSSSGKFWFTAYDTTANYYSTDTLDILIRSLPDGSCPGDLVNRDGYCFPADNPCAGITCPPGQLCYEGSCYDSCANNGTCDPDNLCYADACYTEALCENIICPEGQFCYGGGCFDPCANDTQVYLGPNLIGPSDSYIGLDAGSDYGYYQWSTGDTTSTIITDASGQYWVVAIDTISNSMCTDSIKVLISANQMGECPEGLTESNGYCYKIDDPCEGIVCAEGEACLEGTCFPTVVCDVGNPDSECFVEAPCDNVVCPEGYECDAGVCVPLKNKGYIGSPGSSVRLSAIQYFQSIIWSTGESAQSITVNVSGQYTYDASSFSIPSPANPGGSGFSYQDTLNVLIQADPVNGCPGGQVERDGYCFLPNDPCEGVTCPTGYVCFGGTCYPECDADSTYADGFCYQGINFKYPDCEDLVCPVGSACLDGQCYDLCALNTDCPEGTICTDQGLCVPQEYACDYKSCPEGNFCIYGTCFVSNLLNNGNINLSGSLFGNSSGGRLTENNPIPEVVIYLINEAKTEINAIDTTDATGMYEFKNLPAGNYVVFVNNPPYKVKGDGLINLKANFTNTSMDIMLVGEEYELILNYITGLAQNFELNKLLAIYPNPTSGKIMLSSSDNIGKVDVVIADINGRIIFKKKVNIRKSTDILITNLDNEPEGLKILTMYKKGKLIYNKSILYRK